jgi:hypothetical protein
MVLYVYDDYLQDRQIAKKSDVLAAIFWQSDESKISATCTSETDDLVTSRTTKVTTLTQLTISES